MAASPRLSIIIPAHNEAQRILPTLQKIDAFIQTRRYDIDVIIVDDGSTDKTVHVVNRFMQGKPSFKLIQLETNVGKGAAIKRGMLLATGAFRLFSDADLSTPIEEVEKFWPLMEGSDKADVVIGSRRVPGAHILQRQPIYREVSGRIFSLLVRLCALRGFIDTQCGFKLFTAEAAQKIFSKQTIPGFGFDVEVLMLAKKKFGFKIKEAPVVWVDSRPTKVKLFKDSLRMFWDLFKIRLNWRAGHYDE